MTVTSSTSAGVQRTYLTLMLCNTLAASFIWGINTLFLLDAGLTNTEAFAANAFFTGGQVLFEVPTGVVADTWGRRASYLLGAFTLMVSTLLYLGMWKIHAPFWGWAVASLILGLGFTFFSGAVEAWLVDALNFTGFFKTPGAQLDRVFARGQQISGAAMLVGSVLGGVVAQATNLGVPYIIRAGVLSITGVVAFLSMKDLGFEPQRSERVLRGMKQTLTDSVAYGLRNRPVRWVVLAGPFSAGVGVYAFYAMQPYLLKLNGNPKAYGVAGLAAAIVAGAQIVGGLLVPHARRVFRRRTSMLVVSVVLSAGLLATLARIDHFLAAVTALTLWALVFACVMPVRQTYLNGLIESRQRATVLSFDSLVSSSGGMVSQPLLGRVADLHGYGASYLVGAAIELGAVPFLLLARAEKVPTDDLRVEVPEAPPVTSAPLAKASRHGPQVSSAAAPDPRRHRSVR